MSPQNVPLMYGRFMLHKKIVTNFNLVAHIAHHIPVNKTWLVCVMSFIPCGNHVLCGFPSGPSCVMTMEATLKGTMKVDNTGNCHILMSGEIGDFSGTFHIPLKQWLVPWVTNTVYPQLKKSVGAISCIPPATHDPTPGSRAICLRTGPPCLPGPSGASSAEHGGFVPAKD